MKAIWDYADYYLNSNEAIQQYEVVCCYILKAFILENAKILSTEAKIVEFKQYLKSYR